jgi:hypothetical protein
MFMDFPLSLRVFFGSWLIWLVAEVHPEMLSTAQATQTVYYK